MPRKRKYQFALEDCFRVGIQDLFRTDLAFHIGQLSCAAARRVASGAVIIPDLKVRARWPTRYLLI